MGRWLGGGGEAAPVAGGAVQLHPLPPAAGHDLLDGLAGGP